jgi:gas vesicle protein
MASARASTESANPRSGSPDALATDGDELPPPPAPRRRGAPYAEERDWGKIGGFGAGIVVGALLGAGVALFLAPQSGRALRAGLSRDAGRMRSRADDAFDALRDELRIAARRARRKLRHRVRDTTWKAEDKIAEVKGE